MGHVCHVLPAMKWLAGDATKRVRGGLAALSLALSLTLLLALAGCGGGQASTSSTTPSATRQPTPTATTNPWLTVALSVQGTSIVNAQGQTVTLIGAARYSLEYACGGDGHFTLADFRAMSAWGMNTVRLPISSAYWRNAEGVCPTYQKTLEAAVANAEQAGLYVILDLQRDAPSDTGFDAQAGGAQCPLPATNDVTFWQQLARYYANDPRVIFDIFGEPHDVTWNQWWNGGQIDAKCYTTNPPGTYAAVGMPALAQAVRAVAPRSLIIVSGMSWGYDLSGIVASQHITIPNVIYGTHPWDHSSVQMPWDWPRAFGATATHFPVIATEFGEYDCGTNYIAQEIRYFQQHHMSFLAWAWTPGGCATPSLLANWDGTPSSPYGAYIRQQMLAAAKNNPA